MELSLAKLKNLAGISEEDRSRDEILQFTLDNVRETILNYCGLVELPDGLIQTAYRMALDLWRGETFGQEGQPVTVTSVTEGDTSTYFGASGAYTALQGGILKDYKAQLNRYRRVVWR